MRDALRGPVVFRDDINPGDAMREQERFGGEDTALAEANQRRVQQNRDALATQAARNGALPPVPDQPSEDASAAEAHARAARENRDALADQARRMQR